MTKKLFAAWAVIGLILSLAGSTAAHENTDPQPAQKIDRSMPVDSQAVVTLCVASGTLRVRGWDKNEINVRSLDAARIEFRRVDRTKDTSMPARRVDVLVFDKTAPADSKLGCQAIASVEMDVPAGASVQVQTRDGDITIVGVAGAYAGSQNGDIQIARVTKLVEAGSVGGSIFLKDSSGRVTLSSAGGGVEVMNVRPATEEDTLDVGTVSGDIQLNHVSNAKVTAKTVNGTLTMTGPLAKSGWYNLTNVAGNMVLAMPQDSSFRLNAKVSERHGIISDFQLKPLTELAPAPPANPARPPIESTPKPPAAKGHPHPRPGPIAGPIRVERTPVPAQNVLRRLSAICGTGDATISIASFLGTVRLRKI